MKTILTIDKYYLIPIVRYNLFSVGETKYINKIKHRRCSKCEAVFTIEDFCENSFNLVRTKHDVVSYCVGTISFCSECGEVLYYVINDKPRYLSEIDNEGELFICCKDSIELDRWKEIYELKNG